MTLSTRAADADRLGVGIAADQSSVVVWARPSALVSRVQLRARAASGALGAVENVSLGDAPAVAVNAAGTAAMVWRRPDAAGDRVQLAVRSSGGVVSGPVDLSEPGEDADSPAVGIASDGTVVAAWRRFDGANNRVQVRVRSPGGVLGPVQTLSAAGFPALDPVVAVARSGDAAVVWRRLVGGSSRIELARVWPAGAVGAVVGLTSSGVAVSPDVGIADAGDSVVVWQRPDTVERVQLRAVAADGTAGALRNLSAAGASAVEPDVAVNPSGDAVVVWRGLRSGFWRVQGATRTAAGVVGGVRQLSSTSVDGRFPRVDVSDAGRAVVVWDRPGGLTYAQARSILPDGSLGRTLILGTTSAALEAKPRVDVNETGGSIVTWLRFDGANTRVRVAVGSPAVRMSDTALAHVENDTQPVDAGLEILDEDAELTGATVAITGGYVNGEDVLAFSDQSGITGDFDAGAGVLTLTGTASLADYQAALRSVTYHNTSDTPSTAARTVTVSASDAAYTGAPESRQIAVSALNDAPTVSTPGATQTFTEDGAAVAVDSTLTVTDPDSTQLQGATAVIGGFVAGDRLNFTDQNGITGSFDAGTRTLTLTGNASLADYQTALRSITFDSTSDNPGATQRTITFTVTDSDGADSASDAQAVDVTAVNDAPDVDLDAAGALAYTENGGFQNLTGPAAAVTDADSATLDSLTVTITAGFDAGFDELRLDPAVVGFTVTPSAGAIMLTRSGGTLAEYTTALRAVQYRNTDDDPDDRNDGTPNPTAADRTIEVVADDGPDTSTPATRDIAITPVNDAPSVPSAAPTADGVRNTTLVSSANSVTDPKVTRTVDLESDATDPDGLESGITVVPAAAAATVQGGRITLTAAGDLVYEPPASVTLSSDTYAYQLTDGAASSATITFTVNLAGEVWYVADEAPLPRDGTAARPLDTLAAALAVATTNDAIHIRRAPGDGTLTAGITLQAGQKLLGQGVALTGTDVGAATAGTLFAAGTKPTLTASGVDVVTLANSTEVAGLSINPDGAGGGLAGTNPTGVTVRDTDITDTGTQATQAGIELTTGGGLTFSGTVNVTTTVSRALDLTGTALSGTIAGTSVTGGTNGAVSLTNTTGSLTFQAVNLTTSGGTGFRLSSAAGIDVDGANFATSVSSTGGPAVDATSLTGGTDLAFDTVTASGTLTKGVNLDGTGSWTFSAGSGSAIGATSQVGFDVNDGSGAVSYTGTIANGTGEAVEVTGRSGDTTIAASITGAGGTGITVSGNSAPGTTTFSGATETLNTGASQAVTLSSNTGHTIAFTNGGLDIDTASATGFSATGGGTVTVQGSTNTIDSTSATALAVTSTNISADELTFQRVSSGNNTASADPANGIVLSSTGSAGGLTVTGTDTTDGTGGTIQSTTGDAVSLSSTRSVALHNMVLGNGAAGQGQPDATVNLGDDGIELTSVMPVAGDIYGLDLTNVTIGQTAGHGVNGNGGGNVGIRASNSEFLNIGNDLAGVTESVFFFGTGFPSDDKITGSVDISNSIFAGFTGYGWTVENAGTGTLNMAVTGGEFKNNDATTIGNSGIQIIADGSSGGSPTANLDVTGTNFTNLDLDGIEVTTDPGATTTLDVSGGTYSSPNGDNAIHYVSGSPDADDVENATCEIAGINVTSWRGTLIFLKSGAGNFDCTVRDSTINSGLNLNGPGSHIGRGIEILFDADQLESVNARVLIDNNTLLNVGVDGVQSTSNEVTAGTTVDLTIEDNTIGTAANPYARQGTGEGIEIRSGQVGTFLDDPTYDVLIQRNTLNSSVQTVGNPGAEGIDLDAEDTGSLNATVIDNIDISTPGAPNLAANTESAGSDICLDLRSNDSLAGPAPNWALTHAAGTFLVEGPGAGAVSAAAIQAAQDNGVAAVSGTVNFNGGANCVTPTAPSLP